MTRSLALFATLWLASSPAYAATRTIVIEVASMICATCPITVKKALARVDGVIAVRVSWEPREAMVRYDDSKTDVVALLAATRDAGYPGKIKETVE